MFEGQNTVVDQLVKIIEAIKIGRSTGSLIATRGEGATYEMGTVVFVKGRVVEAKVGRRVDREALNWLSTWGKCRYTFVLSTSESSTMVPEEVVGGHNANVNEAVPYRSQPLVYGLQVLQEKSLSRMHRQVFLLVDGMRKVEDLMRLLHLGEYEVVALLYDLADTGIISIPSPLSF
jgi:hypothetical protein